MFDLWWTNFININSVKITEKKINLKEQRTWLRISINKMWLKNKS